MPRLIEKQAVCPELLTVSPPPHIKHTDTTRSIMLDVIIALVPATVWGVAVFGWRALAVVSISVASSVLFEYLIRLLFGRPVSVGDCSAALTGLLLGLNLPSSVSYWIPVVGSFFAIVVVKQLFGGIGKNFLNPALAGRAFLFAWPSEMTTFTKPFEWLDAGIFGNAVTGSADAVASATPLAALKAGQMPETTVLDLVLGKCAGSIGEISAILLILGGLYLLFRRVITWHIPVAFLGTVAALTFIFPQSVNRVDFMLGELFSGGLVLGAVFMATDYCTSPLTAKGRLIYGVGCGCVTVFIRYFGGYNEGVSFAILMMNMLVWYFDRATKPRVFGTKLKTPPAPATASHPAPAITPAGNSEEKEAGGERK